MKFFMIIYVFALLGQIDQLIELATKGATMGGQALLVGFLILMGWVIRSMHNDNKKQMENALAAHERQHGELLSTLNAERETAKRERDTNHEALLRIATESATGLQATAAAINGSSIAMNSLRDTLHDLRKDMQHRQTQRDLRNEP